MEEEQPKKGLFGGNRSLTIIFIDVLIILVIYAIYTFFLAGPTSARTVDGYRFALSARGGDSTAVVTLRVRAGADAEPARDQIITVRFAGAAGNDEGVITDVLPEPGGAARVFQREVPVPAETGVLEVGVEALGRSFTLGVPVGD
jgi:hypothetical protein